MTRNPDDDAAAHRLELSLREANLDVHQAWMTKAEHYLDQANEMMRDLANRGVPEEEVTQVIALATLLGTLAGSISTFTETNLMVESEAATVGHLRGHLDHASVQEEKHARAQDMMKVALEKVAEEMRASGIDAYIAPGVPGGIVIRPTDDDESA